MRTRSETPETAAARLLERWCRDEAPLHAARQGGSRPAQRVALGKAASYFRVVRSLRRSCDEGLGVPRFEPLRRCLAAVTIADATHARFAAATIAVAQAIGASYGGQSYLSAASKLLWLRYLHPFIIYDSVVRERLGTPRGDYHAHVAAWEARYAAHADAIKRACSAIARPSTSSRRSMPPPAPRNDVACEEWFRRRVLDILIWHGGV